MVRDRQCHRHTGCETGENLSQQADYLLASEAANAGKVILSHADAATREQCEDTVAHLNRALEQIRCDRRIDPEKDILQKISRI